MFSPDSQPTPAGATSPSVAASCHVVIIGKKRLHNELLEGMLTRDGGMHCSCLEPGAFSPKTVPGFGSRPFLILGDCFSLSLQELWDFHARSAQDNGSVSRFALLNVESNHLELELDCLARGLNGVFFDADSPATILKGIKRIIQGELWFSRAALSKSVSRSRSNTSPSASQPGGLSPREREILSLIVAGHANAEIATRLCVSPHTVKTHIHNIFAKIEVPNRMQAMLWATKHNIF